MKPVILTDPDDSGQSWLVAANTATAFPNGEEGNDLIHYRSAVRLTDLKPGQFKKDFSQIMGEGTFGDIEPISESVTNSDTEMLLPTPCIFAVINRHHEQGFGIIADTGNRNTPLGIHRRAAVAMLELARAFNNASLLDATGEIKFGDPRTEKMIVPWDKWKFFTAWMWSDWKAREIFTKKKITLHDRWREMVEAGYPNKEGAFQNMHRELFPKPTD